MNIIFRGGPCDGKIERRVERNTFGIGHVTQVIDKNTGQTKSCIEDYYRSTSDYERDLTRPRAKFRVFQFDKTRPVEPPKK